MNSLTNGAPAVRQGKKRSDTVVVSSPGWGVRLSSPYPARVRTVTFVGKSIVGCDAATDSSCDYSRSRSPQTWPASEIFGSS